MSDLVARAAEAIRNGDQESLRSILGDEPALAREAWNDTGETLLHLAAYHDAPELCRTLVDAGAIPDRIAEGKFDPENAHSGSGSCTALALALENGRRRATEYLASVEVTPDNLWMAAGLGNEARVREFFTSAGALTPEARDPGKKMDDAGVLNDALVSAAHHGHGIIARFLLDRGADPSGRCHFGMTALHYTALFGNFDLTMELLERGADPRVQEWQFGLNPLGYARWGAHAETIRRLEERLGPDAPGSVPP